MSVEDETELKDLLLQALTENGSLAKIKAQLRASVFLALEEDINLSSKKPLLNEKLKTSLNTTEGQLLFCIVKEFLEYFNLESTMAVFDAESYLGVSYDYEGRSKVSADLGLTAEHESVPLLQQIVQLALRKPKTLKVNLNINDEDEVENNISNSSNSIKTETSLSERNSDSGTADVENNEENVNLEYNENEYNVSLNKTFTTEPKENNDTDDFINSNGDSSYDGQRNISNVLNSTNPKLMPVSLPDKLEEVTTPVLKDLKISPERVKSPPKSDKFKSKNNLNSLSDLPPLPVNKTLSGKILPSLYNKEYREKPNS